MKFTPRTIELRTASDPVRQRAQVCGPLAYHAEITLTHVPTGYAFPFRPSNEAQAKRVIEALLACGVDLEKMEFTPEEAHAMREVLLAETGRT